MQYMMDNFGKKFFMIGSDYAWPRVTNLVTKRKLEELGGEVVADTSPSIRRNTDRCCATSGLPVPTSSSTA